MSLSQPDRETFRRDGFLVCRQMVPLDALEACARWLSGLLGCDIRRADPPTSRVREISRAMAQSEAVREMVTSAPVVNIVYELLEHEVFLHPRWIVRVVGDGPTLYAMPPHQDFPFTQGAVDTLTCWIPLHAVDAASSPLLFLPGSHHRGLWPLDLTQGRPLCEAPPLGSRSWQSACCGLGDMVVFHSLAVHATPRPLNGLTRASVDVRYQASSDAISPIELQPFSEDTPFNPPRSDHGGKLLADGSALPTSAPSEWTTVRAGPSRFLGAAAV